jgi:hypothetical protein
MSESYACHNRQLCWHESLIPTEASSEGAGLGRVLDIVLAILQDRDPLKGGYIIPLSLWDRAKGYFTFRKPKPLRRQMHQYLQHPDCLVSDHRWMIWLFDALGQSSVEEICLLADVLSDQLAFYLRALTRTSRGSASRTIPVAENFLYSAFCLAYVLFQRVPHGASKLKLHRIIAPAGVRLQLSDLPSRARLTSVTDSNQSGHEQAVASFVEWADICLQENFDVSIWACWERYRFFTIYSIHSSQSADVVEGEHLFRLCTW